MKIGNTFCLMLLFVVCPMFKAMGQGNLLVTPIRVIFEGNKTREDLSISNIGSDTAVYAISFIRYRMNENGSFTELDRNDPSIQFADDMLRIFPRRVTLPPNESQTIRLQYRRPNPAPVGEMRSHLYFRAEKEVTPLGVNDPELDTTKMSVRITPIFGISIPVIVRNGELSLQMAISDVQTQVLNDSVAQLTLSLNRSGSKSAYGNIRVQYQPVGGRPIEVGVANGVGVYTELSRRIFSMRLQLRAGQKFERGKLLITYSTPFELGNAIMASAEHSLN